MRRSRWMFAIVAVVLALAMARADEPRAAQMSFEAGRKKEVVDGDVKGAVALYQKAVEQAGASAPVAAEALIALGRAYEKLGTPANARMAFERVVREFGDQKDAVTTAKARLGAMGPAVSKAQADASSSRRIQVPNIVLTDINRDGTIAAGYEQNATANQSLVLLNLASSAVTRLNVAGSGPRLSPDGRQLTYSWNGGVGSPPLRIVGTAAGSTPRTLVEGDPQRVLEHIGWSADGKSVIAIAWPGPGGAGAPLLVSVAVSDGTITTLKTFEGQMGAGPGMVRVTRVSPDGRFVAYTRNGAVCIVGIDGQNETAVAQIAGRNQLQTWSADGSRVFFTNTRSSAPASAGLTWDLWSVPVRDGAASGVPSLLQTNFQGALLGASTAGTLYAFRSPSVSDTQNIFVADRLAGSRIVEMFPGQSAAVSPDGKAIALLRTNGPYYDPIVRVVASGAERLCQLNSVGPGSPIWLHDGSGFLVHLSRLPSGAPGPGSFYFINATSCESKLVLADTADRTRGNRVAVSLDNKTLYAAKGQSPQGPWTGIVSVNLETGIESPVATFPGNGFPSPSHPSLALSPDGTTLALMIFARQAGSHEDQARIATVGVDGSGYREIVGPFPASGGGGDTLRWTPDGQSMLFAMMKDGYVGWRIMRVPAGGGQPVFDGLDSASPMGDIAVPTLHPQGPNIDVLPDGRLIVGARTVATNELWAIDNIVR